MKITTALALASAALASACSSQTVPPTGIACPAIALEAPQQLYPIPGATGVPMAPGYLVVSGSVPSTVVVEFIAQGGPTLALGPLGAAPSPLPSPAATPMDPTAALGGVRYPALSAATTYSVHYLDTARPCPIAISNDAEPFTTQ